MDSQIHRCQRNGHIGRVRGLTLFPLGCLNHELVLNIAMAAANGPIVIYGCHKHALRTCLCHTMLDCRPVYANPKRIITGQVRVHFPQHQAWSHINVVYYMPLPAVCRARHASVHVYHAYTGPIWTHPLYTKLYVWQIRASSCLIVCHVNRIGR